MLSVSDLSDHPLDTDQTTGLAAEEVPTQRDAAHFTEGQANKHLEFHPNSYIFVSSLSQNAYLEVRHRAQSRSSHLGKPDAEYMQTAHLMKMSILLHQALSSFSTVL